jgi:hypothetical protein
MPYKCWKKKDAIYTFVFFAKNLTVYLKSQQRECLLSWCREASVTLQKRERENGRVWSYSLDFILTFLKKDGHSEIVNVKQQFK